MGARGILITGANGFLGRALASYLAAKSRPVLFGVRRQSEGMDPLKEVILGSLEQMPGIAEKLNGIETIVHCAGLAHLMGGEAALSSERFHAVNCEGTLHLAREAQKAGVKRLVFISTIGVNGEKTLGKKFRPDDKPAPLSPYANSKLQAEIGLRRFAQDSGFEVVIVRPPLIIGPGAAGNVGRIARMISRGIPLPFGLVRQNRRTVVSIEGICSLIEYCVDHQDAANRVFLAGDGKERSTREIVEMVGSYIGKKPILMPFPVWLLRYFLRLSGNSKLCDQITGDLELDISEAVNTLGWQPSSRD